MIEQIVFSPCPTEALQCFFTEKGLYLPNNDSIITLSASFDGDIIGYAVIMNSYQDFFQLNYLYVTPIFRGMGIGSRFLEYILKYFRDEYSGKKLAIHYNTSYDKEKVDNFFNKNGLGPVVYDSTLFEFYYLDWYSKIYPLYKHINYEKNTVIKEFHELSSDDLNKLESVIKNENIAEFLNPQVVGNDSLDYIRLFIFDVKKSILGWTCASLNRHGEVKILITYILPQYRKFRMGFYAWACLYFWCRNRGIESRLKKVSFDFDKRNVKLHSFYRRVVGRTLSTEIDNYVIKV